MYSTAALYFKLTKALIVLHHLDGLVLERFCGLKITPRCRGNIQYSLDLASETCPVLPTDMLIIYFAREINLMKNYKMSSTDGIGTDLHFHSCYFPVNQP